MSYEWVQEYPDSFNDLVTLVVQDGAGGFILDFEGRPGGEGFDEEAAAVLLGKVRDACITAGLIVHPIRVMTGAPMVLTDVP